MDAGPEAANCNLYTRPVGWRAPEGSSWSTVAYWSWKVFAYLESDAKIWKAAHYLPSLLCLVSTVGIKINGVFLFRSLIDPCKLLYALKSRMHAQVGRQIDKLKE